MTIVFRASYFNNYYRMFILIVMKDELNRCELHWCTVFLVIFEAESVLGSQNRSI